MQNYGYMGYPYSQGYGYNPYGQRMSPQTQPMPQPQAQQNQMTMQPQMPMETPIQDIKFVNKAQAEAYIVFPNSRVLLIDKDSGMAHLKIADNMGQSTTQFYKFELVNEDGSPIKPQEPTPQVNFDEFIKKSDLEKLGLVSMQEFKALTDRFEQMKKLLEGVKTSGGKQANQ